MSPMQEKTFCLSANSRYTTLLSQPVPEPRRQTAWAGGLQVMGLLLVEAEQSVENVFCRKRSSTFLGFFTLT